MNLCFITSNIRFDNPQDGANAWPHRREKLVHLLKSHQPALIATQEGRFDQLKDLESLLGDYQIIDQHRSWIKERMYPSFFTKKNIFEILDSGDLWLSETPEIAGSVSFDSAFPRLMTWIKLRPKNSEINFLVINTHLDHVKESTRIEQIKVLVNEVRRIKDPSSVLVMMGDFNDSPESEVRKVIMTTFDLQDSWKLFNDAEETSHHAFSGECQNGSRIDWILVDSKIEILSCLMDKSRPEGSYPSDHFPVVCQLKL